MARKDITVDYHQNSIAQNMLIVVTGDFDPASAKTKLAQALGAAPAGTEWKENSGGGAPRKGQLLLIDKPDATQTYFQIGQPGIDMKNPDRTALEIINTLPGGLLTSMLNDELR